MRNWNIDVTRSVAQRSIEATNNEERSNGSKEGMKRP